MKKKPAVPAPENWLTRIPVSDETVRGFEVHIDGWFKRRRVRVKLPCQGHPYLTGEEALRAMLEYTRRGYKVMALTNSLVSGLEACSLEEMKDLYEN
jgi:hypothetical protein